MYSKIYLTALLMLIYYSNTCFSNTQKLATEKNMPHKITPKKRARSCSLYHLASIGCLEQKRLLAPGIIKPCYPSTPYRNPNYRPLFWNPQAPYGFAK